MSGDTGQEPQHAGTTVEEAVAAGIARQVRRRVELVGVFVNPTLDEVARAADAIGLTHVQLHGDEGPSFATEAARRTGAKIIKAARVERGRPTEDRAGSRPICKGSKCKSGTLHRSSTAKPLCIGGRRRFFFICAVAPSTQSGGEVMLFLQACMQQQQHS